MKLKMNLTKEYGIVLEGGGAKGGYQIGAWKALREAGIRIKGISGVSVGALNGAMMCMDDIEGASKLWENISYSQIMDVDDKNMEGLITGNLKIIPNIGQIIKDSIKIIADGGVDITPLRTLIKETISEERIRQSPIDLYITTYSVTEHKLLDVDVKETPEGLIGDMLLASAYFLAFKNEKLHGKKYMDGGGWNNIPLDSLLNRNYEDIIVIRIYGLGQEKKVEIPEGAMIYTIAPRRPLVKILEFDSKKIKKNMNMGYYDAQRILYGLEGKWYYLDMPAEESYYFHKMIDLVRKMIDRLGEDVVMDEKQKLTGYRAAMEIGMPKLVKALGVKPDGGYKEIYLTMLENAAKSLRINPFHIYTETELIGLIKKKLSQSKKNQDELPIFLDNLDSLFSL